MFYKKAEFKAIPLLIIQFKIFSFDIMPLPLYRVIFYPGISLMPATSNTN